MLGHIRLIFSLGVLALPLPALAQTSGPAPPNAAHGKALFIANGCAECHGTSGEGGAGPHLAPNPPPAAFIAQFIRHPAGSMPPYAQSVLGDTDIADIAAYLQSVPAPPKLQDIPQLKN